MRRIVYLFILPLLFSANRSEAQSFSMQKDTATAAVYGYIDLYNNLTNLTSDTMRVSWKILSHTFPPSWVSGASIGICDNVTCYDTQILTGTLQTTDTIPGNSTMPFKIQLDVSPSSVVPTTGVPYYVTIELTNGTTVDTVTFGAYKWNTNNVSKVNANREDVVVYPNPAYNDVNVTFNKELGVKNVAVYNLVGKQISNYRVTGNSAKLDIERIPAGIYFLRLVDNNGRVVATRRFTHQ